MVIQAHNLLDDDEMLKNVHKSVLGYNCVTLLIPSVKWIFSEQIEDIQKHGIFWKINFRGQYFIFLDVLYVYSYALDERSRMVQ